MDRHPRGRRRSIILGGLPLLLALSGLSASEVQGQELPSAAPVTDETAAPEAYKGGDAWPLRNYNGLDFLEPLVPVGALQDNDWGTFVRTTALPIGMIAAGFITRGGDRSSLRPFERTPFLDHDHGVNNYAGLGTSVILSLASVLLPHPLDSDDSYWSRRADRITVLVTSFGVTSLAVEVLRSQTGRRRPTFPFRRGSRPSGHAAMAAAAGAFASHMLWEALQPLEIDSVPVRIATEIGITLPSVLIMYVGLSRVTHGKHFLSDVLLGAGIGFLVTEMLYAWSFANDEPGDPSWLDRLTVSPGFEQGGASLTLGFAFGA